MPTFSSSDFVPSKYLVRIESRELTSCQKIVWETELTEVVCDSWQEAQEVFEFTFESWKDYVRSAHSDPEYWIRTRDCFVGEWNIDVFHSNALHPRKYAVDCQIYVCFAPKDPALRDIEWGESDIWMTLNHRLFVELESVYGIGTEPDPEPEPDPDSEQSQPETLIIPIPTWDYVETEPEPSYAVARDFEHYEFLNSEYQPEPEPVRLTRGWLTVKLELHDQWVVGRQLHNLPLDKEYALEEARLLNKQIVDQITNLLGLQPETNWEDIGTNCGDWGYAWNADYYQCGVCKAVFEWGFDFDSEPFGAEEKHDATEPLWLGCITVDLPWGKRSTCSASTERSALAEWLKGSVDAYALISGRMPEEAVGRWSLIEFARDGEQSYRDINVTVGDLVGEGIRLV